VQKMGWSWVVKGHPLSLKIAPFDKFRRDFWRQKTRVRGLSHDIVCVILGLAIFVELRLVTDRRTLDDSIYTALA